MREIQTGADAAEGRSVEGVREEDWGERTEDWERTEGKGLKVEAKDWGLGTEGWDKEMSNVDSPISNVQVKGKGSADYPGEIRFAPHYRVFHRAGADWRRLEAEARGKMTHLLQGFGGQAE